MAVAPGRAEPSAALSFFQMSEAEVNGQFESVCESVFSEVESQAMDALDLPGCFRTRSHSYLRAIQAGYSQDDECVPLTIPADAASTIRPTGKGRPLTHPPNGQVWGTSILTDWGGFSPNIWKFSSLRW